MENKDFNRIFQIIGTYLLKIIGTYRILLLSIFFALVGSVLMDQEVSNSSTVSGSSMESIGIVLVFAAGMSIAFQVWRIGFQKRVSENQDEKNGKPKAIALSALLAFLIVGAVSIPGQTIRFAIDSGEKARYNTSVIAYENEQKNLEIEKEQARSREAQASASASAKAEEESRAQESAAAEAASQSAQALVDEQLAFENSKNSDNGGFSSEEIKVLKSFLELTYDYVVTYNSYAGGSRSIGAVATMCAQLEDFYPALSKVSSSAPYYEDSLDRAKDYYFEAKEACAHGFKKNRNDEINESVQLATGSYRYIEQILNDVKTFG